MANEEANIGLIILDIPVNPNALTEEGLENVEHEILSSLEVRFGPFEKIFSKVIFSRSSPTSMNQFFTTFLGQKGSTLSLKTYPMRSLISVTIEYDHVDFGGRSVLSYAELTELESDLAGTFGSVRKTKTTPEIKRGLSKDIYFITSDERLVEYDIQEMLFDEKSPFQHVQIARTLNFGNTLILDDNVNLADSDFVYTKTIMALDLVDYTDKEILILGGGDGALLNELRKEWPSSITMVEIDDVVIKACRQFMRTSCGDSLDCYKKPAEYEILVGDCVKFMEACQINGRKFDVIFGDLTEIPISPTPQGEIWNFLKKILNLALSVLKDDGWFLTHGNGISVPKALRMYENAVLANLNYPVVFDKSCAFIPSFMEKWVFYRIQKSLQ